MKDYKELNVWKKGIEIVAFVYQVTKRFPKEEKFGLISQMQRASVSIPSNVSEGFARQYNKEFIQYLYMSLGSCAELETQTIVSKQLQFIHNNDFSKLCELLDHESRMLMRLIQSIKY